MSFEATAKCSMLLPASTRARNLGGKPLGKLGKLGEKLGKLWLNLGKPWKTMGILK
jgi:hypothetical protein